MAFQEALIPQEHRSQLSVERQNRKLRLYDPISRLWDERKDTQDQRDRVTTQMKEKRQSVLSQRCVEERLQVISFVKA
ncbi:hypothetical protein CDAR_271631 [Caerostris darwini]|uniref:Uncharacterized protein n=1 Tax=Caerostris darwini TaxID=1538125 RepID=A0AAV4T4W6_9ARAC|nr:hypothetical protein CDAR_271631 [Caerostris darwini]